MAGPTKSQLGRALGPALLCVALAWTHTAQAQLSIDNVPETLIEAFRFHLDKWSEVLLGFEKKLFFALASIELTMSLARAYYEEGGTFDRVGAVLIKRMLFLGFWSTLLFFGPDGIRRGCISQSATGATAAHVLATSSADSDRSKSFSSSMAPSRHQNEATVPCSRCMFDGFINA